MFKNAEVKTPGVFVADAPSPDAVLLARSDQTVGTRSQLRESTLWMKIVTILKSRVPLPHGRPVKGELEALGLTRRTYELQTSAELETDFVFWASVINALLLRQNNRRESLRFRVSTTGMHGSRSMGVPR